MIKWKQQTGRYQNGLNGYLGKWMAFSLLWDGRVSKEDNRKYRLDCYLCGIMDNLGHFKEEKEGKEKAEKALSHWLKHAKLVLIGKANDTI